MYLIIHQYAKAIHYDIQLAIEKEQKFRKREEDYFLESKTSHKSQHANNFISGLMALFTHPLHFRS